MLVEVSQKDYKRHFSTNKSPFVSEDFISLNEYKQDKIVRLMKEGVYSIGLLAGLKDGVLRSPFSAPFGGFHYRHEHLSYELIYEFLSDLKDYIVSEELKKIAITLPPDIYQKNMNAKLINAFIRIGFKLEVPDLNSCIDLKKFDGKWTKSEVAGNCRKAINNNLEWAIATGIDDMESAYEVIYKNREGLGRKIHMTLEDILKVKDIFPVDFFIIREGNGNCIGAAVIYRGHKSIAQGIFMGSDLEKRNLGVIDLMYMKVYEYYKKLGYEYIDLGTSSLEGEPNPGLLRFKENHNSITSLRYSFSWSVKT
jgi:hypothetical protein